MNNPHRIAHRLLVLGGVALSTLLIAGACAAYVFGVPATSGRVDAEAPVAALRAAGAINLPDFAFVLHPGQRNFENLAAQGRQRMTSQRQVSQPITARYQPGRPLQAAGGCAPTCHYAPAPVPLEW